PRSRSPARGAGGRGRRSWGGLGWSEVLGEAVRGGPQPDPLAAGEQGLEPRGHGGRGQLAVAVHLDGGVGGVPAKAHVEQVEGAGAAGGGGAVLGGGQAGRGLGGGHGV